MIKKSVDYWVTDMKLPTEADILEAIEAARAEKAIVILHWHTPAYPYYGPNSDCHVEIVEDDNVNEIMEALPTIYGV